MSEVPDLQAVAPIQVLLADDFHHNRIIVLQYLKNTSCQVDIAENGSVAVEKFKAGDYDLVLMDLQMPVMDGFSATRQIRAFEKEQGKAPVPIIALSAYAMQEDIRKSREAGCVEHLTKPIKKAQLLKALCRHMKLHPQPQEMVPAKVPPPVMVEADDTGDNDFLLRLDKDFADFIPGFLKDVEENTAAMRDALLKNDYAFIQTTSHRLKGAGGGYGLYVISEIAKALEMATREQDATAISGQLDKLSNYLQRIEITFE